MTMAREGRERVSAGSSVGILGGGGLLVGW